MVKNDLILVIFVFAIGFGWGAATAHVVYYERVKKMLSFCTDILQMSKRVMNYNERVEKKVMDFAEVVHGSFNCSISQNEKLVKGLQDLVDAVKEENKNEQQE